MISKIDSWLIDNVYQPIVDASQLKPMWLARQCAAVNAVVGLCRWGLLPDSGYLELAILIPCYCIAYAITLHETLTKSVFNGIWRKMGLAIAPLSVVIAYQVDTTPMELAVLSSATYLSYLYFIACRPPAPPKRKTQLQKGFA